MEVHMMDEFNEEFEYPTAILWIWLCIEVERLEVDTLKNDF